MKIIPKVRKDELWKGIIEELFEDFLHFFFPQFVHEVDYSKPYEFLDKELQEMIPASESKNRIADMLVKVFLKNGEEKWLLIHIEVQGYEDKNFPLRMYVYNYRSFDRFEKEVVALAILTDENPKYRPSFYEKKTWTTKIRYDFEMYKLLDHKESEFEKSDNPFASVMQIARSFIKNQSLKTDEDLLSLKLQLFRNMYSKGHNKQIIRKIANFIKLYVFFENQEFFSKFEIALDNITKYQPSMGLLELIKQRTLEEAERIGTEKGLVQLKAERRKAIKNMLVKKFALETIADILEIPMSEVEMYQQELMIISYFEKGQSVEQVQEYFKKSEKKLLLSNVQLSELYLRIEKEQMLSKDIS